MLQRLPNALPLIGLFATALCGATPAQAFDNAPISCGAAMQPYYNCKAAFDGRALRVTYTSKEGRVMVALYKACISNPTGIYCPEGEWVIGDEKGKLGARSIGLRDGLPFPN